MSIKTIFLKAAIKFGIVGGLIFTGNTVSAYQNPLVLPGTRQLPDPCVIKWMGNFYLYGTKSHGDGIHVWESQNLIDWKHHGTVTPAQPQHQWAPDVFYYNGKFYMYYTNGGKEQHMLAVAESPLGPFKIVNDNFCSFIDGNAFMDDDGQMYFSYSAPHGGISYQKMKDPLTLEGPRLKLPGCIMSVDPGNTWTEAPQVFKIKENYYINYTGNNYINDTYQVHAGKGDTYATLTAQTSPSQVLLRNTTPPLSGTGHNFVFLGPDLKTHYTVYHAIVRKPNFHRPVCLDKVWVDEETGNLTTNGPTRDEQPNPDMPNFVENFSEGINPEKWETDTYTWSPTSSGTLIVDGFETHDWNEIFTIPRTAENYVAEFNLRLLETGAASYAKIGVVTSYSTNSKFTAWLDPIRNFVATEGIAKGEYKGWENSKPFRDDFDHKAWHTMRIEKSDDTISVYVDNLLMIKRKMDLSGGSIGFVVEDCKAEYGWTAFSNL